MRVFATLTLSRTVAPQKMPTPPDEIAYDIFIEAVTNGETLKEGCQRAGYSYAQVARWIAWDDFHAFRYARARAASAAMWADKAVETAERSTALTAPADRIRADVYKWRAGVSDPRNYGTKVEVQADVRAVSGVIMLPAEQIPNALGPAVRGALPDGAASATDAHTDAHGEGGRGVVPETEVGGSTLGPSHNISALSEAVVIRDSRAGMADAGNTGGVV